MSSRRPRGPGIAYAAVGTALVIMLLTLALTARQPPPPTISEFAPQAVENIADSPDDQSSAKGPDAAAPTPTPTPDAGAASTAVVDVPRVRTCVGDPPRQTEDPQSPPCVPYWTGDNGGATSKGVTRDQIRLGIKTGTTEDGEANVVRWLEAFFNKRFEFYGRRITIARVTTGSANCPSETGAAVAADEQHRLFGMLDSNSSGTSCFHEELARRRVVNAQGSTAHFTESYMRNAHPYQWQYLRAVDRMMSTLGEMACARLAGANTIHSTDPATQAKPRAFGAIIQSYGTSGSFSSEPLRSALAQCGSTLTSEYQWDDTAAGTGTNGGNAGNAVIKLKTDGATSILCFCQLLFESAIGSAATTQGYFPEWIVSSFGANDYNYVNALGWTDTQQRQALFGVGFAPRQREADAEPAAWAAREAEPGVRTDALDTMLTAYRSMLLMASGIQMAGPALTPATFASALHKTRFPNPDHPIKSGDVGFIDGDHSMTEDAVEYWWSETARAPFMPPFSNGGTGAFCYVDGGARRTSGAWPTSPDPFFTGTCDSGAR